MFLRQVFEDFSGPEGGQMHIVSSFKRAYVFYQLEASIKAIEEQLRNQTAQFFVFISIPMPDSSRLM